MTSTHGTGPAVPRSAPRSSDRGPRRGWPAVGVLVGLVVVTQAAGLIGVPFTVREPGGWYDQLDKPWFNPPSVVFAPVWTTLYLLIAVAAWLVWRRPESQLQRPALAAYAIQLVLNAAWTPLFFGAELAWWAFAEIVVLLVAALSTGVLFARVDRVAGWLFVPYVAWIAFATLLNGSIAVLN